VAFAIVGDMKTDVKKMENAQVEITVVLPHKKLEEKRDAVVKDFLAHVEVDGFRKGNVPEDIAMKQINPMKVLEEMAQRAISDAYVDILTKEEIKAIGHPQIMITKIAEGSDLEFKITTAVLPEIKLGDYKKIAKTENKKELSNDVDEKEVQDAILNLRKMRAQQEASKNAKEGDEPVSFNEEAKNLEKRRIAIIDGIVADSEIEVPDMMVEYELDKMIHEFEGNIAMTGMSFDDYLKSIEKTREDYRKEWRDQGFKRAQTQLMLNDIAATENIDPSDEMIGAEVSKIMEQYKDQKGIDENNVRAYVATVLTHQEVFKFLDKQK